MTVWDEDNAVSAVTAELVGRNYIKESYVDVQKKAADNADVTIVCDDAYIKNDNGYGISYGNTGIHNNVIPFKAETGSKPTASGKLYVDTYHLEPVFTSVCARFWGKIMIENTNTFLYEDRFL